MRFLFPLVLSFLTLFTFAVNLSAAPPVSNCPNGKCPNQVIHSPTPAPFSIQSVQPVQSTTVTVIQSSVGIPDSQAKPGRVYWRLPDGSLSDCPPDQFAGVGNMVAPPATLRERSFSLTGPLGGNITIDRSVVYLHNAERRAMGLNQLVVDPVLTAMAQQQANAQAATGRMFHSQRPLPGTGENVAAGQKTDEQAHADWVRSPGHYRNIVNPSYTSVGVGRSGNFWAVVFR